MNLSLVIQFTLGDTIYSCLQCAPGFHLEYVNGPEYFRHICTKDEEPPTPAVLECPTLPPPVECPSVECPSIECPSIECPSCPTVERPNIVQIDEPGIDGWMIYGIVVPSMVILVIVVIFLVVRYLKGKRNVLSSSFEIPEDEEAEDNSQLFPNVDSSNEGD